MRVLDKRAGVLALAAVLSAVLAGGVVAAHFGEGPDLEALDAATRAAPLTQVATIPAGNGKAERGVFTQVTSTGHVCLWEAPSAKSPQRQGGCDPADDPLGGGVFSASLAYDGGPAAADVTDARLIGLAAEDVARVEVLLADGTRRTMSLREAKLASGSYRAFGYRFKPKEIRSGGPVAVVALDAAGKELARQPTGFHG